MRTPQQVVREYDKMQRIKRALIASGDLAGDASPADVIAKLRSLLPPGLFSKAKGV